MNLEDLFVSYKQVEEPTFYKPKIEETNPLYFNLERAKKVTTETDPEESTETSEETVDMSSWNADRNYKPKTGSSSSTNPTTSSKKWTNPYTNAKDKWIADLTTAYKKYGLSDNAIKNLIAKNALESGWGKYAQGDFNFGNLTTGSNWTGRYVQGKDKDSKGNSIGQKFRAYDNLDAYVADEIQFLTKLYDFNKDDDFETFIGKLQGNNSGKRKYAGVSDYADRVRRVYNSI